jgi:type VI secretion system ImpC/EvpB family protein
MAVSYTTLAEEVIGQADERINRQLNQILHHNCFQQLEAAWRGIELLTQSVEKSHRVRVRYLPLTLKELGKDLTSISEFDQSQLFKKVYSEQLDQPGGEPFGLLIGDYYLKHTVKSQKLDAMQMLR